MEKVMPIWLRILEKTAALMDRLYATSPSPSMPKWKADYIKKATRNGEDEALMDHLEETPSLTKKWTALDDTQKKGRLDLELDMYMGREPLLEELAYKQLRLTEHYMLRWQREKEGVSGAEKAEKEKEDWASSSSNSSSKFDM